MPDATSIWRRALSRLTHPRTEGTAQTAVTTPTHQQDAGSGEDPPLPAGYRRNFWCLAMDFCFFGIGMAFFGPSTVVPSFLTALGASASVIGLLSALQRAGWLLPQLVAARYLADKPYKKPFILLPGAIGRSLILVLAILIWLLGAQRPRLTITTFVIVMGFFWLADGLASLAWFDFLSKSVPAHRRGRLTSVGQTLSGIASFAAGFAVEWLLSDRGPAYPNNYALLFFIGFLMLALSFTALALGKESKGVTAERVPTWREYLPQIGNLISRDHEFRRYLIVRQVYSLAMLAGPFYITYALDVLNLPERVAGRYTSVGVIGSIAAALLFGWLNERHGTRLTCQVSVLVTTAIPILALLIPQVIQEPTWLAWAYGLVFLMNNASMSSYLPGWTAYVLEWAPEVDRPIYMGLTNTVSGLTAVFSILGGAILQWTGGNYTVLFAITAIGTFATLPLSLKLPEPRDTQRASILQQP
jgi:MFS family permease